MKKLWLLWLSIAILFLSLTIYFSKQKYRVLLLPQQIESVDVIRADATLHFIYQNNEWKIKQQIAPRFGQWLEQLKIACPIAYPLAEVEYSDNASITLRFNDKDDWIFADHNPYNQTHLLIHQQSVYLCSEQLKPRLALPLQYWTERN